MTLIYGPFHYLYLIRRRFDHGFYALCTNHLFAIELTTYLSGLYIGLCLQWAPFAISTCTHYALFFNAVAFIFDSPHRYGIVMSLVSREKRTKIVIIRTYFLRRATVALNTDRASSFYEDDDPLGRSCDRSLW